MPQYNKAEVGRIAQQFGFVRDTFEKVLRLKEILKYFNEQEYLKDHLLLKGGTAINLTVFNLPRMSVDIDMDYTPNDSMKDMLEARSRITAIIKDYMGAEGYHLSPASRLSHSLDAFCYQYQNTGGNRDMIKVEINYSLRAHVLEPVYRNILPEAFDDGLKIRTVDPMEIYAAKGNAAFYAGNKDTGQRNGLFRLYASIRNVLYRSAESFKVGGDPSAVSRTK